MNDKIVRAMQIKMLQAIIANGGDCTTDHFDAQCDAGCPLAGDDGCCNVPYISAKGMDVWHEEKLEEAQGILARLIEEEINEANALAAPGNTVTVSIPLSLAKDIELTLNMIPNKRIECLSEGRDSYSVVSRLSKFIK